MSDKRAGISMKLFMALVHYPVYNRKKQVVATAITNLDIHDIARASKSYGVEGLFIVNPLERQHWLLERIVRHWKEGLGAKANPVRKEALSLVEPVRFLEDAFNRVEKLCGSAPVVIATSAKTRANTIGYSALRDRLAGEDETPHMILLGTGWGLTDEVIQRAGYVLKPILDGRTYNHLSVRSAASIMLDRLLGDR